MLLLFKGQLSLQDILWGMPYKRLFEIKEAREQRLMEEEKEIEKMQKNQERADARNAILQK